MGFSRKAKPGAQRQPEARHAARAWHAAKLRLTHVSFPLGLITLVRAGPPDPAIRPTGGLHVTRQRSGAGRAAVAEAGGQETLLEPATGRECSLRATSLN